MPKTWVTIMLILGTHVDYVHYMILYSKVGFNRGSSCISPSWLPACHPTTQQSEDPLTMCETQATLQFVRESVAFQSSIICVGNTLGESQTFRKSVLNVPPSTHSYEAKQDEASKSTFTYNFKTSA